MRRKLKPIRRRPLMPHRGLLRRTFFASNWRRICGSKFCVSPLALAGSGTPGALSAAIQGCSSACLAVNRALGSTVRHLAIKSRAAGVRRLACERMRSDTGETQRRRTGLRDVLPILDRLELVVGTADGLDLLDARVTIKGCVACSKSSAEPKRLRRAQKLTAKEEVSFAGSDILARLSK